MFKEKLNHVKVLPSRYQMNGHAAGFCPQVYKLEHCKTPSLALGVKTLTL